MSRPNEDLLPVNTADLLTLLDEIVPPRCIGHNQTPEAAHRYAGKRDLVEELKLRWKEENEG